MSNLRLIPHSVSGIRAALRRDLHESWRREEADILCLQEVRCRLRDLLAGAFIGHRVVWSIGEPAGRNGVAVLASDAPERIATLSGTAVIVAPDGTLTESEVGRVGNRDLAASTGEGRYVEVDLAGLSIRVASLYLLKGAVPEHHTWKLEEADTPKYEWRMKFLSDLARHLTQARESVVQAGREYAIVGDFNITNTRHDLKDWRSNQHVDGFLPEKRDWFTVQLGLCRLVDVVRSMYLGQGGLYSWWSWWSQAFVNDAGWRIDYHLTTPKLMRAVVRAEPLREADYDSRVSNHYPVAVDYDAARLS